MTRSAERSIAAGRGSRVFVCVCFLHLRGASFLGRTAITPCVCTRALQRTHERQHNRDSHDRRGRESDLFIILSCLDKNLRARQQVFFRRRRARRVPSRDFQRP